MEEIPDAINPSEVIYSITMQSVLSALHHRHGIETLTVEEIILAKEEVREAINHNLDEREYIDLGLDAWEITRNL